MRAKYSFFHNKPVRVNDRGSGYTYKECEFNDDLKLFEFDPLKGSEWAP